MKWEWRDSKKQVAESDEWEVQYRNKPINVSWLTEAARPGQGKQSVGTTPGEKH